MAKEVVATPHAPAAIGPYSQAIKANGFVFTAGQIALDPSTAMVVGADVRAQTERVCENLKAVLAQAGSGFDKVVKTTVFLKTMDDFAGMNEVYGRYFTQPAPARSTVAVVTLPKNVLVEIDVVALA
jgi:2-iminobutanoate/2-iminopropanoate deaminase